MSPTVLDLARGALAIALRLEEIVRDDERLVPRVMDIVEMLERIVDELKGFDR